MGGIHFVETFPQRLKSCLSMILELCTEHMMTGQGECGMRKEEWCWTRLHAELKGVGPQVGCQWDLAKLGVV